MLKVLVIDADSDFASLIGRQILKADHETRIVGDAKYGIVRAKSFEADLVLLSGSLPGVSTPDFITVKPMVPGRIVVCGDSEDAGIITAAVSAGASDYVLKESGPEKILARVLKNTPSVTMSSSEDSESSESAEESDGDDDDGPLFGDAVEAKASPVVQLRAPLKEGKRPFVVVVAHADEDKRAFQKEIVERLNSSLHVMEVATSADAIVACAENRTIMVIIDWELADPPTKQAMKTIREAKNGKAISVFVTYKSHSPEKQRLAEFGGAVAFAGEPWTDGSLEGVIRHTLTIKKRRRRARIQALKAQEEAQAKAAS